jgi:hypothetical protein
MKTLLIAAIAAIAGTLLTARAEEPSFEYRELESCKGSDETIWRPARMKVEKGPARTVVRVDALFNCARSPKNPAVQYSPVSTTLAVEESGVFGAMCLCKHLMQFTLPRTLEKSTTLYFSIEGKVYGHETVR